MILEPAVAAMKLWEENNWGDVIITAGVDGNHVSGSKHYRGQAIDIREPVEPQKAVLELQRRLPNWRVIFEVNHLHCQRIA